LNANESATRSGADPTGDLRRYPEPQPCDLVLALAGLYGCAPGQLILGRGSDEAIDLLIRAACAPGRDAVVVTPPVFGMYAIAARLHGARAIEVPLVDGARDFTVDLDRILARTCAESATLVFLCSPGNPACGPIAARDVLNLASALEAQALVVVDEAYIDFADVASLVPQVSKHPNLVVLRTLSKAHALAGARIGCAIADADVVAKLRRCQAPYPVPAPCASMALAALQKEVLQQTRLRNDVIRRERERIRAALCDAPNVRRIYPSQTNFLLVRFADASAAYDALLAEGIVVRDMRTLEQLGDALRITIGTPAENDRVLLALGRAQALP
jgi:histidinol-phosphate aminotransferase